MQADKMVYNGRVDLPTGSLAPRYNDYSMVAESVQVPKSFVNDALKGNIEKNEVSKLFFSDMNIQMIQRGIKNLVLNKTCGKTRIGNQSVNEILVIMRSIYLLHSINSFVDVLEQVRSLNSRVLQYSVEQILSEVSLHESYLETITTLPKPMAYGENTSTYGTKSQEFKPRF
jgi:hypothetical protein